MYAALDSLKSTLERPAAVDYNHKKNHAASLFLIVDQIAKENQTRVYLTTTINLEMRSLLMQGFSEGQQFAALI